MRTGRVLRRFIALPYRLHARDPVRVPPLRREVKALLDRRRNPFFEHGEAEYFLAEAGGRVVGRIAAIVNRLHNETHRDRVGFFGFFESEQDPEAAALLLETAGAWVRARGMDTLRGPASFSTNDECGLLVHGFDTPNTLMMPHNPPWYADLVTGAGGRKARDLLVYEGGSLTGDAGPAPERLRRGAELVMRRLGLTLRTLRMPEFAAEVERIRELYNRCWEMNWGFVPLTDGEIRHLAAQFRPLVIPEMIPIVEKDGVPVAFGLVLPDLNEALRTNRSGRLLPALPRLLWTIATRSYRRARILLLGVTPEYRGKGIDAVLYEHIWRTGTGMGIHWGEAGWILEDNAAMNQALEKMGFRHYKTYRLYDRPA